MKPSHILIISLVTMFTACGDGPTKPDNNDNVSLCFDGVQNGDEEDVDCGGACDACDTEADPTCRDGEQNGDEEGVDCGGVCRACEVDPTCEDGVQNGDETDVDCGGSCDACTVAPTCSDGMQNGSEEGIDCGGTCAACPPVASCTDGIQNGTETDVDCGGDCPRCVLPAPAEWTCEPSSYDNRSCDCGCGVIDVDCANATASVCVGTGCTPLQIIDAADNSQCLPLPEGPGNPSFEVTPAQAGTVPSWTIVRKDGTSDIMVVGPAQTTAPDGSRALFMTSTYRYDPVGMMGFPSPAEVESSRFLPVGAQCELTVAMGDINALTSNSDYGEISVVALGVPSPLNILARKTIDTRGGADSVEPTEGSYEDVALSFMHDGSHPLKIVIIVDASFNTKSFHVDDVRVNCQ